jgi:transcriptional regulator of acetoin/glycerol metabolism
VNREALREALEACDGNQSEVARQLGVNRCTVWRMMKRWGL